MLETDSSLQKDLKSLYNILNLLSRNELVFDRINNRPKVKSEDDSSVIIDKQMVSLWNEKWKARYSKFIHSIPRPKSGSPVSPKHSSVTSTPAKKEFFKSNTQSSNNSSKLYYTNAENTNYEANLSHHNRSLNLRSKTFNQNAKVVSTFKEKRFQSNFNKVNQSHNTLRKSQKRCENCSLFLNEKRLLMKENQELRELVEKLSRRKSIPKFKIESLEGVLVSKDWGRISQARHLRIYNCLGFLKVKKNRLEHKSNLFGGSSLEPKRF